MKDWLQLRQSMQRSATVGVANFILLAAPVILASLCFEAVFHGTHLLLPGKHTLLDMLLVAGVCFPLGLTAEGVLANLYLRMRSSRQNYLESVEEFLRRAGLASTVGRLLGMTLAWLFIGLLAATVVGFFVLLVVVFFRTLAHPGVKSHIPGLGRALVWGWLAVYAFLASRYSFVLPRFAMAESFGEDFWNHAVARAKAHSAMLGTLCAVECVSVLAISWLILHAGRPAHEASIAMKLMNVIVCGFVSAYCETVKVDLTVADAHGRWGEIQALSPRQA